MNIIQQVNALLASLHITEHDLLLLAIGVIIGMMLMRGGGSMARRAMGMVRRRRPRGDYYY